MLAEIKALIEDFSWEGLIALIDGLLKKIFGAVSDAEGWDETTAA